MTYEMVEQMIAGLNSEITKIQNQITEMNRFMKHEFQTARLVSKMNALIDKKWELMDLLAD